MNIRQNIAITIAALLLTIIAAFVAMNMNESSPVKVIDGVQYVQTEDHGLVKVSADDYDQTLTGSIMMEYGNYSVKYPATPKNDTPKVNTIVPAKLPNTSAPSGEFTCTHTDENGNSFTVTSSNPCK